MSCLLKNLVQCIGLVHWFWNRSTLFLHWKTDGKPCAKRAHTIKFPMSMLFSSIVHTHCSGSFHDLTQLLAVFLASFLPILAYTSAHTHHTAAPCSLLLHFLSFMCLCPSGASLACRFLPPSLPTFSATTILFVAEYSVLGRTNKVQNCHLRLWLLSLQIW